MNHSARLILTLLLILTLSAVVGNRTQAQTIAVDTTINHQTITGWQTVTRCWEIDKTNNRFDTTFATHRDAVLNTLVNKLGVNRIKFGIASGMEDTIDYWPQFVSGQMTYSEWGSHSYEKCNDDNDPNTTNPNGFQWAQMDWQVENMVLPMQQLMAANGEKLMIAVDYVDFNSSVQTFSHVKNPAEYAELITVVFQHLKTKYNIAVDALEIMLEPDIVTDWTPTNLGLCLVAAVDRLNAAGFYPTIVAPSTSNGSQCVPYYDQMVAAVPASAQKIDVLGYHRYWGPSYAALQGIDTRAKAKGLQRAMTEWLDATINTLIQDLTLVNVSFWEQWGLCAKKNTGHNYLWADFANPASPVIKLTTYSNLLQQYFKYIRHNAVRVEATSPDTAAFYPVAFKNTNGKYVVVVRNATAAPFSVQGLPAGTYGITYSSGTSAYTITADNVSLPDVTIAAGGSVTAHGFAAGAVTIFGKPTGTSTAALPVSVADNGLRVYPNPSSRQITFSVNHAGTDKKYLLEIFNLSGRKVGAVAGNTSHPLTFEKGTLPSGAYIYKFYGADKLMNTGKVLLLPD